MKHSKSEIKSGIEKGEKPDIELEKNRILHELTETTRILLDRTQVFKTSGIDNKQEEKERYLKSCEDSFKPDFRFHEYPYSREKMLDILNQCIEETEKIDNRTLERYGCKTLEADEMQKFFRDIFQELKLNVKLASGIEKEKIWKKYSEKIWKPVEKEEVQRSREKLKKMEQEKLRENIKPEEVAEMFRNEIDRLGAEYTVEVRDVAGCHNIPQEKTVVVARGENGDRTYSREEARMVTMHEIFHAMRAYNGFKAGEKSGFPEIIGLHTPFYDRAEEGGAVYREHRTGTSYRNKKFDYHLRMVAVGEIAESDSFREDFTSIAEKLVDLGATRERAFELLTRNREGLRHHIYLGGYHDWKKIEDKEKMLVGKVNEEWAEKFWKEAEADGMIQKPEIGSEKLFDFTIVG